MPDEIEVTEGETPEVEQPAGETPEDDFDKERAMATIQKQREAEREALKKLEAAQKKLEQFEEAERKRKEAQMSETEKLQAQLAEREAELKRLQLQQLQYQAAKEAGLPDDFAPRLKGETLEELRADAEALAKVLPKPTAPKISPTQPGSAKQGESEAQQRARVYGWGSGAGVFDPEAIKEQGGGVRWVDKE